MSIRKKFVARFGEQQAIAIEAAANEHMNGIHDNPGSDRFRWAIAICLGYECMSKQSFREYHGITASWELLRQWIKDEGNLAEHDGDVDFIALACGWYDEFVDPTAEPKEWRA